ncbi:unnamed protein product [Enterobius vermicularis]|uniref:Guanylate cyclase domain-containing protein n=1 Tax=Enterobius vermicularis TaxID=51028 RepID=A0A0N4USE7_ENTVE|nr:unnamed protein product [Enterobius vermicularis]
MVAVKIGELILDALIKHESEIIRKNCEVFDIAATFLDGYEIPHRRGQKLHCRWGFNSGSVFSGVVGLSAPRYCIFGETTLLASKMENKGIPDRIQTTFHTYKILTNGEKKFLFSPRGSTSIEMRRICILSLRKTQIYICHGIKITIALFALTMP